MARMYYTMEETKAALGQSEDYIFNLVREGKLREFRMGPALADVRYRAEQVEEVSRNPAAALPCSPPRRPCRGRGSISIRSWIIGIVGISSLCMVFMKIYGWPEEGSFRYWLCVIACIPFGLVAFLPLLLVVAIFNPPAFITLCQCVVGLKVLDDWKEKGLRKAIGWDDPRERR